MFDLVLTLHKSFYKPKSLQAGFAVVVVWPRPDHLLDFL